MIVFSTWKTKQNLPRREPNGDHLARNIHEEYRRSFLEKRGIVSTQAEADTVFSWLGRQWSVMKETSESGEGVYIPALNGTLQVRNGALCVRGFEMILMRFLVIIIITTWKDYRST